MIRKILIILSVAGILASLIWLKVNHDWEPVAATIGAIGSLIALLYTDSTDDKHNKMIMKQKGGKKSKNFQSGGDITINKK